jgi:hypothetical protein
VSQEKAFSQRLWSYPCKHNIILNDVTAYIEINVDLAVEIWRSIRLGSQVVFIVIQITLDRHCRFLTGGRLAHLTQEVWMDG